jgi:hypothetical protein
MTDPKEDSLESDWVDILGLSSVKHGLVGHPGELVLGTNRDRILVRIQPDGQLLYGKDYDPNEAAEVFWTALATKQNGSCI